jgi:ATP-dependent DNA ligase
MLAKTYKKHKDLMLPASISEKLDGVPGDFYKGSDGGMYVRSRQDEPINTVEHVQEALSRYLPEGAHVIGELYIRGMDFKDISGIVRRKKADNDSEKLRMFIHDFYVEGEEDTQYADRMMQCADTLGHFMSMEAPVRFIPGLHVTSTDQFDKAVAKFKKEHPDSEGLVIRPLYGPKTFYRPAWRSPGILKLKWTETIDLKVVSFEEALAEDGTPKGMVGRINVMHKGKVSGIGPGKMKHDERIAVFQNQSRFVGKMVEAAFMPDDSYEGLREGRFWRWRPDKD